MYDVDCFKLARSFLGTQMPDDIVAHLAQHIQDEVESWIEGERDKKLRDYLLPGEHNEVHRIDPNRNQTKS